MPKRNRRLTGAAARPVATVIVVMTICWGRPSFAEEAPSVRFKAGDDPRRPAIAAEVSPVTAAALGPAPDAPAAQRLLSVVRLDDDGTAGPPMFGTYRVQDRTLSFVPEFRLSPSARYRATLNVAGFPPEAVDYVVPAGEPEEPPRLDRIYPSGDRLPANLLKFYLCFSRPMRDSEAIFDRLHILDAQGEPVHDPWRRQSLWSDDGCRLTLLIHPGRIKKGVNLREELGPVLRPGAAYTLVVDAEVLDDSGRPLGRRVEKKFTTLAEDSQRPSLERWKIASPKSGTREPLSVTFDEPLDHALAQRLLFVKREKGDRIQGRIELSRRETHWHFTPDEPWDAAPCRLEADSELEDLAGNTPRRLFDADLDAAKEPPAIMTRSFHPRP